MVEDKKLTDNLSNKSPMLSNNEIIKGLEKEIQDSKRINSSYALLNLNLLKETVDLINRLQVDCENYKQVAEHQQSVTMDRGFEIKRLKEKIERLQAENERLKESRDRWRDIAEAFDRAIREEEERENE